MLLLPWQAHERDAMRPKSIKKTDENVLMIVWDNGHQSTYELAWLRDQCPCAGCQGESILLHTYHAPPQERTTPGRNTLTGIQPVGSYAVQLQWGDGHNTGIYTWERLMDVCQCDECAKRRHVA